MNPEYAKWREDAAPNPHARRGYRERDARIIALLNALGTAEEERDGYRSIGRMQADIIADLNERLRSLIGVAVAPEVVDRCTCSTDPLDNMPLVDGRCPIHGCPPRRLCDLPAAPLTYFYDPRPDEEQEPWASLLALEPGSRVPVYDGSGRHVADAVLGERVSEKGGGLLFEAVARSTAEGSPDV